ncbi:shikimate kinase [Lysinimonas soli]|uniref:Shikimate kinase n=1 Tax=Lysinimonas soli TaxID=1074233 RepID=A0ABW0NPV6_9MICO
MSERPPVVLIGPMGAGKTRIGKRVARILGTGFVDTDRMIVAEHGPIADIFDTLGEPHFRALERDAVARALRGSDVVALGGGAVLDADTRAALAGERVVLVTVAPEAVAPRLRDGRRPLVRNGLADWERIYAERRPIYEQLARLTVDTSHRPIDAVAQEVAEWSKTAA